MKAMPAALVLAVALAGCGTTVVPVVTKAEKCDVPPALRQDCDAPVLLATDITYGQLLDSYLGDRQRLRRCVEQRDALQAALDRCNGAIDAFNAKLEALNPAPK